MTSRMLPEPEDDRDRAILAHIAEFGWSVMGIELDDEGPSYSFSLGLYHTFGHPELIIVGQKPLVAQGLINHASEMIRGERSFVDSERTDGLLEGYEAVLVGVD